MAISILNHDKCRMAGIDVNSYSAIPRDCFEVTFEGSVIDLYERNGYDDSDFYAVVWNEERQVVDQVGYATTRGGTYANNAAIDATPEVLAKVDAYWKKQSRDIFVAQRTTYYKKPHVGAMVRVARGRKVQKGLEGRVATITKRPRPFDYRGRDDLFAFVMSDTGSWTVKVDHLEVIPEPGRTEAAFVADIAAYDARLVKAQAPNGRSILYQGWYAGEAA
jgi:hypothetical protein